jgi:2-oxoglutarate ferredoxin oxidoreductase subunit gamma
MTEKIIIAGEGGQGIMLLGKVLAEAAMREHKHVTWLPAYGAEVRGGAAYCMVIISDQAIGSPFINLADTLIIMNSLSFNKFSLRAKKDGVLIINSSLIKAKAFRQRRLESYPFTDVAAGLGNLKVANMVALGCYLATKKTLDSKKLLFTIEKMAPKGKEALIEINKKALFAGMNLIRPLKECRQ